MKLLNKLTLILSAALIIFTSCNGDNNKTELEKNLPGDWTVTKLIIEDNISGEKIINRDSNKENEVFSFSESGSFSYIYTSETGNDNRIESGSWYSISDRDVMVIKSNGESYIFSLGKITSNSLIIRTDTSWDEFPCTYYCSK